MSLPLAQLDLALVELIARFYLYVVPPAVVLAVVVASRRGLPAGDEAGRLRDRVRAVRWVGLLNYGLALRGALLTVPEFAGYLRHGAFPSLMIINVAWPLATAVVHLPVGFGLRRLLPWARRAEVVLCSVLSFFGLLLLGWLWAHGASVDPAEWPDLAASKALPLWVLLVMLLPRTARAFASGHPAPDGPNPPSRPSAVSLTTLAFLLVLGTVVAVNAADWLIRIGASLAGVAQAL